MEKTIELNLYCDEVKPEEVKDLPFEPQRWAYIGMLVVPTDYEPVLLQRLLDLRCGSGVTKTWGECDPPCKYHAANDKEVHFAELKDGPTFRVAQRWMNFLMEDRALTHFYVLGIDLGKLDLRCFGEGADHEVFMRIYNRFFRTAVLRAVKSFFHRYDRIVINSVVHDYGDQIHDDYFPWHLVWKVGREDPKVSFACDEITFLDSNHRDSHDPRSNFLQYTDVILGAVHNAIHWSSRQEYKEQLALTMLPLIDRLINAPGNRNSRYAYVGRQRIEFFPRKAFKTESEFERAVQRMNAFYTKREIRIKRKMQGSLFEVAVTAEDPKPKKHR